MASIGQSLVVLLCFVQSGTAIQCLLCQSPGYNLDSISQNLYRNYDRRCEDNPSAATSFGECSGSCYYLRVTQSLTKTDSDSTVNSRDWVRGCLATTSVEEGCMNLTLANLEDIQNILPNSVSTVTAMEGRLCVCNSDRCNVDTTSLATLPQVPAVQCPKCEHMEYTSSDFMVQLFLGLLGNWFLGETDQKCVSSPSQTKTVSCRGSCLSSVGDVTMSVTLVTVTMKLTERLCSASKSADGCSRLTDSDAAMTGLFTLDSLTDFGLQSHTTSAEVCTCNQDGCTRPMTTVSGASTTTTTPTKTTPFSITPTKVTPDNHVSTKTTTPHSTNKPEHYESSPATAKSRKPTHSTTTHSSRSTTLIKDAGSSAVTATHKPQTSSSRGVFNLELLLTTLMAATYCMLWCLY
ncbi:A-agglutinin anchorage subunit [Lingula anatina]|uniref:A-agglutinin anchorage subunit n=1 Tax=Lingula anatina TaxID=7574 RepID=A0A1S3K7Z2_LINAN|nr:A-agglutinin anchorage subunit [Lingula anatina]|eukprot:XP_013418755.1 A-agglutinin anchorage subunit [Lingula anatina]